MSAFIIGCMAVTAQTVGEQFLWPMKHYKSWTVNGNYRAYSSSVQTSLAPKICVGVFYSFTTKNFRWHNKKQFYNEDDELKSITTK